MYPAPGRPKGRLLGGSSMASGNKPSKLAALAASRKKAQEERKKLGQDHDGKATQDKDRTSSVALPDKLRIRSRDQPEDTRETLSQGRRVEIAETEEINEQALRTSKRQKRDEPPAEPQSPAEVASPKEEQKREQAPPQDIRKTPSSFATALLGPNTPPKSQQGRVTDIVFSLAYPGSINSGHQEANADPFSGPSPDDVVNKAQFKGVWRNQPPSTHS